MDFFASQDAARKRTFFLIFVYFIAVVLIVVSIYLVIVGITFWIASSGENQVTNWELFDRVWNLDFFIYTALAILAIISGGTLFKTAVLGKGGAAVATLLGGQLIPRDSEDPNIRKLLNVVEEMALASGIAVPPVYVLSGEDSINAFAAGFKPGSAVIGITRGCLEQLSRDELQGVIAHEFSHIFNGDMRLNIRLMGILHGILIIAIIGRILVQSVSRSSRRVYARKKGGDGRGVVLVFGFALMTIGYIGVLCGKLIKSAISRQREYLADAAAVQFTRNPLGLAGALGKIAKFSIGGRLDNAHAEEASHMFFVNGVLGALSSIFATHPPVKERIRRLSPEYLQTVTGQKNLDTSTAPSQVASFSSFFSSSGDGIQRLSDSPEDFVSRVGTPTTSHLTYAAALLNSIPTELHEQLSNPFGARAVILALLINKDIEFQNKQLDYLSKNCDTHVFKETMRFFPVVQNLHPAMRLPLVDLAVPALKTMSDRQYEEFRRNITELIEADSHCDIFEFALEQVIEKHLTRMFGKNIDNAVRQIPLQNVVKECSVVLTALAQTGTDNMEGALKAFNAAKQILSNLPGLNFISAEFFSLSDIRASLVALSSVNALDKRLLLKAFAAAVIADGTVTIGESELLRAVADTLDCPVPPLLPNQA